MGSEGCAWRCGFGLRECIPVPQHPIPARETCVPSRDREVWSASPRIAHMLQHLRQSPRALLARRFWPNSNAVGQSIVLHRTSSGRPHLGEPTPGVVIGVVSDMHSAGNNSPVPAEAWVPYTREMWPWITVLARADNPAAVAAGIRKAVLRVEPNIPINGAGQQYARVGGQRDVRYVLHQRWRCTRSAGRDTWRGRRCSR